MKFCNIDFNVRNKRDVFIPCEEGCLKVIIPVNASLIVEANTTKRFFDILHKNYVTFDGRIPYIAAVILSFLHII
jgi:hypothetical protein